MAQLTGTQQVFHSDTSVVDTSQVANLGTRGVDGSGNEYIYLKGVGSTAAGDWVVYDEDFATTRLTANEVGPVAIAMAAVDATTKYGWYQIFGKNTIAKTDTVAADKSLYIDGTTGRADDAGVAGDLIIGAYSMTADTSNVATVMLNYPHVSDDIGGAAGSVGGSDTQVQFNDGGSLGGDAGFTYNKTTDTATLAGNLECDNVLLEDSDASHYLTIAATSNLTAARTLSIATGDAARTITLSGDLNIAADLITSGANSLTLTTTAATNVTLPTTGTLATRAGTETLTNKTIALGSNTVSGTKAEFDTAVTDDNFAYLATAQSFTALQTFTLAGNAVRCVNTTDGASVQVAKLEGDRATMAANDEAYLSLILSDSAGNQDEFARITWKGTTVTSTSEAGRLQFGVATAGTLADELYLTGANLYPAANDGLALGLSGTAFADLFLASGAVIDFAAADAVITHSAGVLTVSTGDLRVTTAGTNAASAVTVNGTQTLANKTLTAPKIVNAGFIADANGNEQIIFNTTASAVNEVAITNAATGTTGALIQASGETDVDLRLSGKGTGAVHIISGSYGDLTADTDGATITFNLATSNIHTVTLGGNRTLALSNVHVGQCFMLRLLQDGTGSRTVTWFTTITWAGGSAPTLTTTANKADLLGFLAKTTTTFDGFVVGANI